MSDTPKKWERLNWYFSTGDVCWEEYGGLWGKEVGDGRVIFLEMMNLREACGMDAPPDYMLAEVSLVSAAEVPVAEMASALDCCDAASWMPDLSLEGKLRGVAECLHSYGCKGVVGSVSGTHAIHVRGQGFVMAEGLLAEEKLDAALDRVANGIGSSVRDMMQGDCLAGLRRHAEGLVAGDVSVGENASSDIMLKMYAGAGGQTLGGKVEGELATAGRLLKETEEEL